ncbi:MAG: DUF4097 family beta strand repeat-containing protein [Bacteroidota bacterium]
MNKALILFGIFLGLISLEVHSQDNALRIPLTSPNQPGRLKVHVFSGIVHVKGCSRNDVMVRYEALRPDKQKRDVVDVGNGLKKLTTTGISLEAREKDNVLSLESDHRSKPVRVMIEVPFEFDLEVETHHFGDIEVINVSGEIVLEAHHGKIDASGIAGSMVANTWHGHIVADFDKIYPDMPLAFTTYHGKIDIQLPPEARFNLKAQSVKGDVLTGFDIDILRNKPQVAETNKDGTYKIALTDWVRGRVNGGGPELHAKTQNANIYIRKKQRF